jgi:hypothetical protein
MKSADAGEVLERGTPTPIDTATATVPPSDRTARAPILRLRVE